MRQKNWKVLAILVASLMVAALFAGCGVQAQESSAPATTTAPEGTGAAASTEASAGDGGANEVLRVGIDDSQTGTGAPYGLPAANAIKMAADEVNKEGGIKIGDKTYDVEVVNYDNKSDATEGVSTLQKLIDLDQVDFILGWSSSTPTSSAAQQIIGKEATMIIGNARAPQIILFSPGNVFRGAAANSYDPIADCEFMKSQGVGKIAILAFFNDTGFSVQVNNVINAFGKIGVEVVAQETLNPGDLDVLSQATNIANSGADAVYIAANVEESSMALRQLRELGCTIPMFTFSSGTGEQWLSTCTNEQMEGSYSIRPQEYEIGGENGEESQAFLTKYQEMYNEIPGQTATNGYDNFWILMSAMQKAGTTEWEPVNKALKELKVSELDPRVIIDYIPLEDGKLFDELGQAYHPYTVEKWDMETKNWAYEATIGKDLGPDFLHNYLKDYCEKEGLTYPGND